jgi:hypothetical protein
VAWRTVAGLANSPYIPAIPTHRSDRRGSIVMEEIARGYIGSLQDISTRDFTEKKNMFSAVTACEESVRRQNAQ